DNSAWVIGWLTEITYANGGKVEVTYNGQYGQPGKLKTTKVTGPMGYVADYTYTETEVQGQEKPNVTFVKKDSLAQETTFALTDNQAKKKVTDALGNWTESVQDSNGNQASFRNKCGKITTYTYDTANTDIFARSNQLSMTNPLNKTWAYEYDANNNRTKTTDPLAHTQEATYDAVGNVLTQTNGLAQTTLTNTYTTSGAKGLLATTKDGLNNETAFTYDSFGLMTKITDPVGKETTFSYASDGSGNQIKVTNPLGKEWKKEYNGFSKPSKTIDPLNNQTNFDYDTMANLTKVTDAESRVTEMTYDKLQRTTSIKDALNNTTSFTYDTESNVTKITDALAREFTYTFDAVNQTKTWVFPDNNQESYDCNANGSLTKITRRGGQETTFTFDDADRLAAKTWTGTTSTVFTPAYDNANRLTGLTKIEGNTTISQIGVTYNAANQATAIIAEGNTTSYAYDGAQRLNQIMYPSSEVVKYGFNSRSALESIKNGSNAAIADYTFDDAGRATKKTLPNGLETLYEYNDANWVTKITLRQGATPNTVLQSFQYGYNKVGNRTWVQYANGSGDVYQYDGTDQLIGVKYGVSNPQDGCNLATGESRAVTYTYDALGNRSVMLDNLTLTNYTVNNLNQYTQVDLNSFTYDTNGNLTGDGTWTFGYDQEGHLITADKSGTSVSYKYDALGRRIGKNVNGTITQYVYSGQDLIEERDGSNNITAKYVYAGGIDNPVEVIKGTNAYFFQQDALGNVTALTNSSGAIVESYTYDVFGKPKTKDGSGNTIDIPSTPFLFTGREYDPETGLYHYRSRAYSPKLGRFLQMDSIGFGGEDLNLYRYVSNNSVNSIDPLGKINIDLPWYGNYGGPGWTNGGLEHEKFPDRNPHPGDIGPPKGPTPWDGTDTCYMNHDICIAACKHPPKQCPKKGNVANVFAKCKRDCKIELQQCLRKAIKHAKDPSEFLHNALSDFYFNFTD
ncbi:MAG: RHS repeat-associated core domain-containing protein, partial [bacterium]